MGADAAGHGANTCVLSMPPACERVVLLVLPAALESDYACVGGRCAGRWWGRTASRQCPRPPSRRAWACAGAPGRRRRTRTSWTWLRRNRLSTVSAAHARGCGERGRKWRWAMGAGGHVGHRQSAWLGGTEQQSGGVCEQPRVNTRINSGTDTLEARETPCRNRASIGAPSSTHMLVRTGSHRTGFFGYPYRHRPDRARSRAHAVKEPLQPPVQLGFAGFRDAIRPAKGSYGAWWPRITFPARNCVPSRGSEQFRSVRRSRRGEPHGILTGKQRLSHKCGGGGGRLQHGRR